MENVDKIKVIINHELNEKNDVIIIKTILWWYYKSIKVYNKMTSRNL